jgi:hypothetical protein
MSGSIAESVLLLVLCLFVGALIHKDALLEHEINKLKMVQISLQRRVEALEETNNVK